MATAEMGRLVAAKARAVDRGSRPVRPAEEALDNIAAPVMRRLWRASNAARLRAISWEPASEFRETNRAAAPFEAAPRRKPNLEPRSEERRVGKEGRSR